MKILQLDKNSSQEKLLAKARFDKDKEERRGMLGVIGNE